MLLFILSFELLYTIIYIYFLIMIYQNKYDSLENITERLFLAGERLYANQDPG